MSSTNDDDIQNGVEWLDQNLSSFNRNNVFSKLNNSWNVFTHFQRYNHSLICKNNKEFTAYLVKLEK